MKNTRWIAMLLTLCMVIGLMPTVAQAAPVLEKKAADSWTVMGSVDAQTLLDAGDEVFGEAEPNDDPSQANWIYHDVTVSGTLSGSDVDCYEFEIWDGSPVTVVSACTTGGLIYGLFEADSQELIAECEYLGLDEESGLYMDGFTCEVPGGRYFLLFLEMNEADAEYAFYFEAPGYETEEHYHDYGDGIVTKAPTCTENGVMTYTCSCGDYYTEEILADGHNFSGGKCTVCGATGDEIIASGEHDHGPITWKITAEGVLTISGNRIMQDRSAYEWADYAGLITRVVVEDGITNIPKNAFHSYPNLESVYIGNTVTVIKEGAFNGCTKLSNVTIPASVTELGTGVFARCSSLKDIKFESGSKLETIPGSAFEASGLTKVTLPSSVRVIDSYAYYNCQSLTEAILLESVEKIGRNAFQDCGALKTVGLPSTLEQIMSEAFLRCYNITRMEINSSCDLSDAFPYQESLTTVVFGNLATVVPNSAFKGCVNLTSVTIGNSVERIEHGAFSGCTALKTISIPDSVGTIESHAFSGSGLTTVTIPESVTTLGGAFSGCKDLKSVKLGKNVTTIASGTFNGCTALTEINLENVTAIELEAFMGCTSLTALELSKVESIAYYAFKDCTGLKTVVLPETLTQVEHSVFWGCTALNEVVLPESLKELSTDMFHGCTALTQVTIPAGVESLSGRVFKNCQAMESIQFVGDAPVFAADSFDGLACEVIYPANNATWTEEIRQNYGGTITWTGYSTDPDSTGSCGTNLTWELYRNSGLLVISGTGTMNNFDYNSGLWAQEREWITSVVVNEGVTSIGEFAFYNLENLVSVSLPNSLQVIGEAAFSCTGITEINIPASVIQMYTNAFESCFALERIIVAEGNKYYCNDSQGILYEKDMKTLLFCPQGFAGVCTIPEGVEKIAKLAFHYCDKLTAVQMANTVTTIGESAFQGCYGLESVILSEKLEVIGKAAFADCSMLSEMTFPESVTEIGEGAFSCAGLTEITFKGAAPVIGDYAFEGVTANVHYPMNEEGWTEETTVGYGGTLKWIKDTYYRISGVGRSETAIEAANELKEVLGIEKFDTIILASGEGFADALAGSYLAVKKDAPILLVRKTTIELNKNYILDNLTEGGTVYILGGTAAVPQEMEDALEGLNVVRIKGEDRFDTNLKILEEAGIKNEEILICTGWNFADSLSASATGLPILMLNTTKDALTADQEAFLAKYADNKFTVIGGTAAVSEKLEADVEAIVGEADRVYGGTREETSVKIAQRYFSVPDYALVAYSRNFPDGLCGGPLAHALKAPLLLVNAGVEAPAAEYIKSQGIPGGAILGGPAAVSEDSAQIVFGVK